MDGGSSGSIWRDYLHEGESITLEHKIGLYDVATTNERVMFVRRFPELYTEAWYHDIHSLSHRTRVNWSRLFKALIWFAVGCYAYTISPLSGSNVLAGFLYDVVRTYLRELEFLPIYQISSALVVVVLLYGLYNFGKFIPTLRGVFIISLKNKSPIRVSTSLTPEIRDLMQEIDAGMSKASKAMGVSPRPAEVVVSAEATEKAKEALYGKIRESIIESGDSDLILIQSNGETHADTVAATLGALVGEQGKVGVYIALSRPYTQIAKQLEGSGIPPKNMLFIDCISYMTGEKPEKTEGVVYIENPSSLEEIGVYLDMYFEKNKPSFVFLDSLDSLMIYNDEKTVREFTHYLINKLRLDNLGGVILSVEKKEVEELIKTIIPMCDKEIRV